MSDELALYKRALQRERSARKSAEKILEQKATELFELNRELNAKNFILQENFVTKEKELQDLFKNLVEGYVITNLDGFVLNINESAKKIFDLKPSGSFNLFSLIPEQEKSNLNEGLQLVLRDNALSDFELKIITSKGTPKTVLINASAVKDKSGATVALQALIRDVTAVRKLEADRESLLTKLKRQNGELEEYAHVISHDLKSPLRNLYTLNTWLQEITSQLDDPKLPEYYSMIFSTLERMDNLIFAILNFSKSDKDAMHFENVDLATLLHNLSQQYITRDNLTLDIAKNFPMVYGVKMKLLQVFQNLIDNAIKFNDKDHCLIKITFDQSDDQKLQVSVHDNGKGISERQQGKVFKLFETTEKNQSSSGVGLSIVKKILEAHQAEILLESKVHEYTKFSFDLKKAVI